MGIANSLANTRIDLRVSASDRDRVFCRLAELLATGTTLASAEEILQALNKRELLGSTGLGGRVAIPHGRISGLTECVAALVLLDQGIEFDAVDGEPVEVFCAMIVGDGDQQDYLQLLASLAQLFSEPGFHQRIRECDNANEILALLQEACPDGD